MAELLALAHRAEQAGWDGVRFGDPPDGPVAGRECWAIMGALASTVPRIRLDAVVRHDLGRHPAVVAKLASTVDHLSGGRLLLGFVGQGASLEEAIRVVKGLARGDRVSLAGRFYRLHDAPLDPRPVQQPFPVMVVGANAELAASCADHWSIAGSPAQLLASLSALDAACRRLGRDRTTITVSASRTAATLAPAGVDEWVVPDAAVAGNRDAWTDIGDLGRA